MPDKASKSQYPLFRSEGEELGMGKQKQVSSFYIFVFS